MEHTHVTLNYTHVTKPIHGQSPQEWLKATVLTVAMTGSKEGTKLWNFTNTYASVVVNFMCQIDWPSGAQIIG